MSQYDIGIDLGTNNVRVCIQGKGIVYDEPCAIAYHKKTDEILAVGQKAYEMLERTPPHIIAVQPLTSGVVDDFDLTTEMIKIILQQVCGKTMVKPRVVICVPSIVTEVEARAMTDAVKAAGARKVYLVEEPFAAALGCSHIDISKPQGNIVVTIGGATTSTAVLSLKGIACRNSVKIAGGTFDQEIIQYLRRQYAFFIGNKTAEQVKIACGCTAQYAGDRSIGIKGRCLKTGLPKQITVSAQEIAAVCHEVAMEIIHSIQEVIERTPPELVGDLQDNGIALCGGCAKLGGFAQLISQQTRLHAYISEDPELCVAFGAARAFAFEEELEYGMVDPVTYRTKKFFDQED